MNSGERTMLYAEQTDDIYRAIGKFSVKFEQLVFYMGKGITFLLSQNGLKNQQLSNIILSDQTAYPVKTMFSAMIYELIDLSDKEKQIVREIFKKVQTLIDKRNNIVHSTWFVGWATSSDTNFRNVSGYKLTKGKSGAGVKGFNFTSTDFDQFSDECDLVTTLVNRLGATVMLGSIESNFYFDDSGDVVGGPNPDSSS